MSFSNQKKQPFTYDPKMASSMGGKDMNAIGNMAPFQPFLAGGEDGPQNAEEAGLAFKRMAMAANGAQILGTRSPPHPDGGYQVPSFLERPWKGNGNV